MNKKEITIDSAIQYLYNPNNKLLTSTDVMKLLSRGGLATIPKNLDIYQQAMIHRSFSKRHNKSYFDMFPSLRAPEGMLELFDGTNEKLECRGDSILSFVTVDYLMTRYPDMDEGFITKMKIKIVCGSTLSHLAEKMGFTEYILFCRFAEEKCNARRNPRFLEDVFEAFLGALYLDQGYETARSYIIYILENLLDMQDIVMNDDNYKDRLQNYFQQNFNGAYTNYQNISVEGPANNRVYTVCVLNPYGKIVGIGKGPTKKLAEQNASKNALIFYGVVEPDEEDSSN